jgi:hypothetical protein
MKTFKFFFMTMAFISVATAEDNKPNAGQKNEYSDVELSHSSYGNEIVLNKETNKEERYQNYFGMTFDVDKQLESMKTKTSTCKAKFTKSVLLLNAAGMESKYIYVLKIWDLVDCK